DPETIASQKQFLPVPIPESKGEHPTELLDAVLPPPSVTLEDYFRIGLRPPLVRRSVLRSAPRSEATAQLAVIVDFAVVAHPIPALRVLHRLLASGREVQDRQPCVSENDRGIGIGRLQCLDS